MSGRQRGQFGFEPATHRYRVVAERPVFQGVNFNLDGFGPALRRGGPLLGLLPCSLEAPRQQLRIGPLAASIHAGVAVGLVHYGGQVEGGFRQSFAVRRNDDVRHLCCLCNRLFVLCTYT